MNATGLGIDENREAMRLMCANNAYDRACERVREAKEAALSAISEHADLVRVADREADDAFAEVCDAEDRAGDKARDAVRRIA